MAYSRVSIAKDDLKAGRITQHDLDRIVEEEKQVRMRGGSFNVISSGRRTSILGGSHRTGKAVER